MTDEPADGGVLTVADLVRSIGARPPPLIERDASLRAAIEAFERHRHARALYVVDEDSRLVGVLTAGNLLRHVEWASFSPRVHARRIPALLGTDTVDTVMLRHPVSVRLHDTVREAVQRMNEAGSKELPVLDDDGHVVADVTVIDALYHG